MFVCVRERGGGRERERQNMYDCECVCVCICVCVCACVYVRVCVCVHSDAFIFCVQERHLVSKRKLSVLVYKTLSGSDFQ